jgi:signal transduction histidine kinase
VLADVPLPLLFDAKGVPARGPGVLQGLFDALPFYVMLVDAKHHVLLANQAVFDKLKVERSCVLGGYCPKVVHGLEVGQPYPGCPIEEAVEAGIAAEREYDDPKTGQVTRSWIYPTPYRSATGQPVFLHTTNNITAQRRAEAREARGYEAQRLVNDLLRVALQSESLEEILEQVVERVVGIPWLAKKPRVAIFLVDESGDRLLMKAQRGLEPQVRELCASVPFGRCLCGRAAASRSPQFCSRVGDEHEPRIEGLDPHGHYCLPIHHEEAVFGVLSTGLDEGHKYDASELEFLTAIADVVAGIVQRKRTEELQRAHQRVAESRERMARVGEISAGVAHTVRNPLHGVMSCVDIVASQAGRGEPASPEILGLMRDGLERIERITRRLLALTREVPPDRRPTCIADLLDDAVDLMAVQANKKLVWIELEVGFGDDAIVDVDRVMEGLISVIGNAVDASEPNSRIVVRSRLRTRPSSVLELEVEDHGSGIPPEHLPRVLDPFFTTKPVGEGSGLGLAITRRVMDEHGGEVVVDSEVGRGTIVRLRFPRPLPGEQRAEPEAAAQPGSF